MKSTRPVKLNGDDGYDDKVRKNAKKDKELIITWRDPVIPSTKNCKS